MKLEDLDYPLRADQIAQVPAAARDASRLLVLSRAPGTSDVHARFSDLPRFLTPGDLLVLNDARVLPARLVGTKPTGGRIEILLVEPEGREASGNPRPGAARDAHAASSEPGAPQVWSCLAGFSRAPHIGDALDFGDALKAVYLGPCGSEMHRVELRPAAGRSVRESLDACGRVPLPPYIEREEAAGPSAKDALRYQTIYAEREGAIAAPTAGLHFTEALFEALADRGVETARITLHVGPATFLPVRTEHIEDHPVAAERYEVPRAAAQAVARARERGGRVIAVGTTVVRALESASDSRRGIVPARGRTDLFIAPGFRFRVVDALITNFHLPRSTLLALVCAFAGRERILEAYRNAAREGYRFYSYGDATLIV